jgi:xylulokinase
MASMRIHSRWMQVEPDCIYATGGASRNRAILQVMADIHGCPVHVSEVANGAALGAALRAFHAHQHAQGVPIPWDDAIAGFTDPSPTGRVDPNPDTRETYAAFVEAYRDFEAESTAG